MATTKKKTSSTSSSSSSIKTSSTRTKNKSTVASDTSSKGARSNVLIQQTNALNPTSTPTATTHQMSKSDVFNTTNRKQVSNATSTGMSSLHLVAMLENFQLEADAQTRALKKKQQFRLETMKRHWTSSITNLDPRLRSITLARFLDEFEADTNTALRAIVLEEMRSNQTAASSTIGATASEKGGRKRKRAVGASSPTRPELTEPSSRKAPSTSTTHIEGSIKKPRAGSSTLGLGQPSKPSRNQPASSGVRSVSGKRLIGANGSSPAAATRKTRQTTRGTDTSLAIASSSRTTYRVRPSTTTFDPNLPKTPFGSSKTTGGARAPRRGESIVLRSINDSPLLGELIADDDDEDDQEEEGQEGEEEADWSIISPVISKNSKNRIQAPSKKSFSVKLPSSAPIYSEDDARKVREQVERETKKKMIEDLTRKLDETVLDRGERERLLGVLNGW